MARPILRLATRFTRRTRMTAWAIAFACMVLVGAMALADGLANGVGSVADRVGSGPTAYIHGADLLASQIDPNALAGIPGDVLALRAHPAILEINATSIPVIVVAVTTYHGGNGTDAYPIGSRDLSLDAGLREEIEEQIEAPLANVAALDLFGLRLSNLPIVPPPPTRSPLFPDDWVWVRADLLTAMDPVQGGAVQAIVTEGPLDDHTVEGLGVTRLETLGAVGFFRAGVAEIQGPLRLLALLIGLVIALLVYAATSLEVHARSREIATLRSLGASGPMIAAVYEAQAILLAVAGAILGAALGILLAHAVVAFAPLFGLPNLVVLAPPVAAVGLTVAIAFLAAAVAGLVPSRRAAVLVRTKEVAPT